MIDVKELNNLSIEKMNKKLQDSIPYDVRQIIDTLQDAGFEAYAVGGCVRDTILGRTPGDWDITTSALPQQVKKLFRRTIDTGIKHGTVTIMKGMVGYEVTTYRIDGDYSDGRHPDSVEFTSNLVEDLKRRDFTINAMAYNPRTGIVDEFQGIEDLKAGRIRCVGNAMERFTEDNLRILRAVRFSAQLGFEIDESTCIAMKKLAYGLNQISKERIMVELDKLITSDHPENIYIAYECGITKHIMPEFDKMMETAQNTPYHLYSVGEHTIKVMEHCEKDHYLRWAALFHDIGKPDSKVTDEDGTDHFYGHAAVSAKIAKDILKRLKSDNKTIEYVTKIVACHSDGLKSEEMTEKSLRRQISRIGVDIYPYFMKIRRADLAGKSNLGYETGIKALCYMEETYPKIMQAGNALCLKDLAVNGKDLIEAGFKPGKELGDILNKLFIAVVDEPELNTKEKLIELAKNV